MSSDAEDTDGDGIPDYLDDDDDNDGIPDDLDSDDDGDGIPDVQEKKPPVKPPQAKVAAAVLILQRT